MFLLFLQEVVLYQTGEVTEGFDAQIVEVWLFVFGILIFFPVKDVLT